MIKIKNGRKGYHLMVDNLYISFTFIDEPIRAIRCKNGIPYGATEWISIKAIRNFWNTHRENIIKSTQIPYKSVWGQLLPL